MNIQDCHRILQVPPDANLDEVKAAFRKHAFRLHPDLNPSPRAAEEFRRLNEAYILLTRTLKDEPAGRAAPGPGTSASAGTKADHAKAGKAYGRQQAEARRESRRGGAGKSGGGFHIREEEVLRDLLADPFARQVFEDIYSQLKHDGPAAKPGFGPPGHGFRHPGPRSEDPPARRSLKIQWGEKSVNLDMGKGLVGGVKSWLRSQLDDEHSVYFPAHSLGPGKTLRITVSGHFGGHPKTVDITLPPDFVVGRPIRLKGLGRKLGPFTGDLFLSIYAK